MGRKARATLRNKVACPLFLLLAGCGWKSDGLERLELLYPTVVPTIPDAGPTTDVDLGTPDCSGFDGRWAVRLVQKGTIAPLGPPPWSMTVTDLFLAESTNQAFTLRFCDQQVAIDTGSGQTDLGRSEVPGPLRDALARAPLTVTFPSDAVWLWGIRNLANPKTDALPTKDNFTGDARVWDEDGDGKPGVSLKILAPAGEASMVRRAAWSFAAPKLTFDNQWITGALSSQISESRLEATNALLLTVAPITPKSAVYQLRCVGPTFGCASLAAEHPRVFQAAPP